jgi:hypothetical protein
MNKVINIIKYKKELNILIKHAQWKSRVFIVIKYL